MGYQESFMFCKTKKDLTRLCRVLNHAYINSEISNFVDVYRVGRFKQPIHLNSPWSSSTKHNLFMSEGYFVSWGGERHPIQSSNWLEDYVTTNFSEDYVWFNTIFCEYIDEVKDLVKGCATTPPNKVYSDNFINAFTVDGQINLDLIREL